MVVDLNNQFVTLFKLKNAGGDWITTLIESCLLKVWRKLAGFTYQVTIDIEFIRVANLGYINC